MNNGFTGTVYPSSVLKIPSLCPTRKSKGPYAHVHRNPNLYLLADAYKLDGRRRLSYLQCRRIRAEQRQQQAEWTELNLVALAARSRGGLAPQTALKLAKSARDALAAHCIALRCSLAEVQQVAKNLQDSVEEAEARLLDGETQLRVVRKSMEDKGLRLEHVPSKDPIIIPELPTFEEPETGDLSDGSNPEA